MNATSEHPIVQDELDQAMIDAESAALLRMKPEKAALVRSVAWQIAKDGGLDDWRQALPVARRYVGEGAA